jgi:hypothetical protein
MYMCMYTYTHKYTYTHICTCLSILKFWFSGLCINSWFCIHNTYFIFKYVYACICIYFLFMLNICFSTISAFFFNYQCYRYGCRGLILHTSVTTEVSKTMIVRVGLFCILVWQLRFQNRGRVVLLVCGILVWYLRLTGGLIIKFKLHNSVTEK